MVYPLILFIISIAIIIMVTIIFGSNNSLFIVLDTLGSIVLTGIVELFLYSNICFLIAVRAEMLSFLGKNYDVYKLTWGERIGRYYQF